MLKRAGFAFIFCNIFPVSILFAQSFPVSEIIINGDRDKRINIVFLPDGYMQSELSQFQPHVERAAADLFNAHPYLQYRSYFNVFAIEVASNESGADHPGTASDESGNLPVFARDTYFNSSFDVAGVHRLLVPNTSIAQNVLINNFPDWDSAFMIVNHDWYGGSGGFFSTFSLNVSSSEIAIHELGHSFASLADEYESGNRGGFEAPNTTAETIRDSIKWHSWIENSTPIPTPESPQYGQVVGLFEGAVYNTQGWYRPKLDCKMRSLGVSFCEICSEQIVLSVYNLLDTIESFTPQIKNIIIVETAVEKFSVTTMMPSPNTMKIKWYLNDQDMQISDEEFIFDARNFDNDDYVLRAVATDTVDLVRRDPEGLLASSVSWNIRITRKPTGVENPQAPNIFELYPNYPNPFNPTTTIHFEIGKPSQVQVDVFNQAGQKVATLLDKTMNPGVHQIIWDARDFEGRQVSSGIYFYSVKAGSQSKTGKMVLLQ